MPDRSLRIALLTHSVNPRGGVVHTLELAEALHAAGHRVCVMAPAAPGQRLFRPLSCAVELVPVAPVTGDVAAMVASRIDAYVDHLAALLRRQDFDVWHAQDSISGNALAELKRRGAIDGFVRTVHHLDSFDDVRLMDWQRQAWEGAQRVLCVSRLWQDTLRREHGVEAARVGNGVDMQRYTPLAAPGDEAVARRLGLRQGAPVLLAVGGIEERKNTLRLFEAFVALHAAVPDAQLVIAGGASLLDHDRYARAFEAAVAASGLRCGRGEVLVLTGPVADDHMPALFRRADALLMPSLREGFGLVVLEALASGTPVVVSRTAPFTEYLADTPEACWCDPLDIGSIAQAMQQALARPAFAPPPVCRRYSWAASAGQHLALYRSLAARPALPVPETFA